MSNMKIIMRKIKDLNAAEYNPRQLTGEQFEQIKASINRFGIVDPIIVNKHKDRMDIIVGGHQRVKVARELGIESVPTVEVNLSLEKERELNVRLNKNTGEWDWDGLANNFDIDDLLDWGFSSDELDVGFPHEEETESDAEPQIDRAEELNKKWNVKFGDLWLIGEHRLVCGDSTKAEDVAKLMGGEKADMVWTDPPYGIGYSSDRWANLGPQSQGLSAKRNNAPMIAGDEKDFDPSFLLSSFVGVAEIFVWGFQYYPDKLGRGGVIVWNKKTESQAECAHGDFELCWSKAERNRMCWLTWGGFKNKETGEDRLHTTQKPVALAAWFFNQWGKAEDVVADPFLGSGTTMVAAQNLNRKCYGLEISPAYCAVILQRMTDAFPDIDIRKGE